MSKLGFLDQMFYQMELNGSSPMVMGGAMIFDTAGSPYPLTAKMFAAHLAARMEKIPLMRKKVVRDGLKVGSFRLVDDPEFSVTDHISLAKLPKPGGYSELACHLGNFSGRRLDLSKPLWHYEVIDGLENGRIAMAIHVHHALLDGIGAMQTLQEIFDLGPVPAELPTQKKWVPQKPPTGAQLIGDAVTEVARNLYVEWPKLLIETNAKLAIAGLDKLTKFFGNKDDTIELPKSAAKTPKIKKLSFNSSEIVDARSISYVSFPLASFKAIKNHFGCTINDVVLLVNSYALDYYLEQTCEMVDCDLVALMPISTRKSDQDAAGNAWTAARVNLHNLIAEPTERLAAIVKDTKALKQPKPDIALAIDGIALMGLVSPSVLDPVLAIATKFNLLAKLPLANIVITNVPGSPVPLYIAGAQQVEMIPFAPALEMIGLTATVTSSGTTIAIGYHGYGDGISDIELFAEGARKCHDELVIAAQATNTS